MSTLLTFRGHDGDQFAPAGLHRYRVENAAAIFAPAGVETDVSQLQMRILERIAAGVHFVGLVMLMLVAAVQVISGEVFVVEHRGLVAIRYPIRLKVVNFG